MKKVIVEHGSVIVDVDGEGLTAVMVDKQGQARVYASSSPADVITFAR